MQRSGGVLMPISALPGDFSCGDFGRGAYAFADFLSDSGFSYWQVLPFCMPDPYFSPYLSCASFGGNPFFIDLNALFEKGLLSRADLTDARQQTSYTCEYNRLSRQRFSLLQKAAAACKDTDAVDAFLAQNPALADCCTFLALKERNGFLPWQQWTWQQPDPAILRTWRFIQYEFYRQWDALHRYLREKNISVIGDLPFYVAGDSSDVFFAPDQFLLDADGKSAFIAGVPPDYFAKDGQLWGNPVYNFKKMAEDGFSFWKKRVEHAFSLFDAVRLDHFRAISDYYCIPAGAKTAREGHWEPGPGMQLLSVIRKAANGRPIFAENLGIIDRRVDRLLAQSGCPGMAVFQFGFDGNADNPHLPHNYHNNLIAYTGTHDNNTLLGFMWELPEAVRRQVLSYIGFSGDNWDRCYDTILRIMLMSSAGLVIFPIQDLLGFGADTRFNTPGRAEGNWAFRITDEQLRSLNRGALLARNRLYGRCR